jgi:hypothetical protein
MGVLGLISNALLLPVYLVRVVPYSIYALTGTLVITLTATEVFVGRPRIWLMTGAVTPKALPMALCANIEMAAAPSKDLLEIG